VLEHPRGASIQLRRQGRRLQHRHGVATAAYRAVVQDEIESRVPGPRAAATAEAVRASFVVVRWESGVKLWQRARIDRTSDFSAATYGTAAAADATATAAVAAATVATAAATQSSGAEHTMLDFHEGESVAKDFVTHRSVK